MVVVITMMLNTRSSVCTAAIIVVVIVVLVDLSRRRECQPRKIVRAQISAVWAGLRNAGDPSIVEDWRVLLIEIEIGRAIMGLLFCFFAAYRPCIS